MINVAAIAYLAEYPEYTAVVFQGAKDHALSIRGTARDLLIRANPRA
jgi:hypothetical protein